MDCCQVLTGNASMGELTYKIPVMLKAEMAIGQTVIVPLGTRLVEGLVTGFDDPPEGIELKEIVSIASKTPVFDEEGLDASLVADGLAFSAPGSHLLKNLWKPSIVKVERKILLTGHVADLKPSEESLFGLIMDLGEDATLGKINTRFGKGRATYALKGLVEKGIVRISDEVVSAAQKERWHFELASEELKKTAEIPDTIDTVSGLAKLLGVSPAKINRYIKDGAIIKVPDPKPIKPEKMESPGFNITYHEGLKPLERIELYSTWARETLSHGRSMVILAPTVSAVDWIYEQLSQTVHCLACTGSISEGQTQDLREVLEAGANAVVVGLAGALFLPLTNIARIVMDEPLSPMIDTDAPFELKLSKLARIRAERSRCELDFCGTPFSLENVMAGGKPTPIISKTDIINMAFEIGASEQILVSEGLIKAVNEEAKAGRPTVILLNRKGFSNFVYCDDCGEVQKCPKCQIPLTYHSINNTVSCRFCGFKGIAPETCPSCGSLFIRFKAGGTERLRFELEKRLGAGRILFAEGGERESFKNLRDFGKPGDVLVSTTMMLDRANLENVKLVAVASLDGLLSMPVFSSTHKAYSLVSILAGRLPPDGRLLIQTYMNHHPLFEAIREGNVAKLLDSELEDRRDTGYPPYTQLLWWHVLGKEEGKSGRDAQRTAQKLRSLLGSELVTGPNAGYFHRLKGGYRWDILIKMKDLGDGLKGLRDLFEDLSSQGTRIEVTNPNP